jgi:hypothetical protein
MNRDRASWKFEGFCSPNTTQVPDEFFDVLSPHLSGGEVKVLLYIIRRTFGFKKDRDNISLSQMLNGIIKKNGDRLDFGAGMSKPSLCRALKTLTKKEIIIPTKQFDYKGGCIATNYQLSFHGRKNISARPMATRFDAGKGTPGKEMRQGVSQNLDSPLVKKRDTQYTVNNIQLDNNVNVANKIRKRSPLHKLEDVQKENDHIKLIAADILEVFGDNQSKRFYLLVARKIPEDYIRETLSELKQSTARSKARVFTRKMLDFVDSALNKKLEQEFGDFKSRRVEIAQRFRSHQ